MCYWAALPRRSGPWLPSQQPAVLTWRRCGASLFGLMQLLHMCRLPPAQTLLVISSVVPLPSSLCLSHCECERATVRACVCVYVCVCARARIARTCACLCRRVHMCLCFPQPVGQLLKLYGISTLFDFRKPYLINPDSFYVLRSQALTNLKRSVYDVVESILRLLQAPDAGFSEAVQRLGRSASPSLVTWPCRERSRKLSEGPQACKPWTWLCKASISSCPLPRLCRASDFYRYLAPPSRHITAMQDTFVNYSCAAVVHLLKCIY
jgi:hypothetical protein